MSASTAALIAHVGIDALGDYLLPHDMYDDVAHGSSRSIVSCAVSAGVVFGAFRLLLGAFDHTRQAPRNPRALSPVVYVVLLIAATFVLLAAMELVDVMVAGGRVDDIADVFGGSVAFAVAVTLPAALAVAWLFWHVARCATRVQRIASRVVGAWLAVRARRSVAAGIRGRRPARSMIYAPALARSTSKRGPPILLR